MYMASLSVKEIEFWKNGQMAVVLDHRQNRCKYHNGLQDQMEIMGHDHKIYQQLIDHSVSWENKN